MTWNGTTRVIIGLSLFELTIFVLASVMGHEIHDSKNSSNTLSHALKCLLPNTLNLV